MREREGGRERDRERIFREELREEIFQEKIRGRIEWNDWNGDGIEKLCDANFEEIFQGKWRDGELRMIRREMEDCNM